MLLTRLLQAVPVLLLVSATVACRPREESGPRWKPEAGVTLRTTVLQETSQELVQLEISIDGEPLPPEMVGDIGIRIDSSSRVVCEDVLDEVRGHDVQRFRRRFVELAREDVSTSQGPEGEAEQRTAFTSPLTGHGVAFVWNPRDRRFEPGAVPGEGPGAGPGPRKELLDGLTPELDLRAFLPAPGAHPGDEWPVSPRALAQVVQPGGDLAWTVADSGIAQVFDARRFADNLQGIVHAHYLAPEEGDDADVARVALSVRVDTRMEQDLPPELDEFGMPTHSTIEIGYRLTGELRWDLVRGHARDLELAGKVFAQSTQTVVGGEGEDVFEQTDRLRFEGTTTLRIVVEAP